MRVVSVGVDGCSRTGGRYVSVSVGRNKSSVRTNRVLTSELPTQPNKSNVESQTQREMLLSVQSPYIERFLDRLPDRLELLKCVLRWRVMSWIVP